MADEANNNFVGLFSTRLTTLEHILEVSEQHFHEDAESILDFRIVEDMLPLGTQIAYTCNQPYNFSLWCEAKETDNLSPELGSLSMARGLIEKTKSQLQGLDLGTSKLAELKRINLSENQYLELTGIDYVQDFLIPNFYFHLSTAYNILRMKGAPLGKANYMMHLAPFVKET